jgi:hypothetical protein
MDVYELRILLIANWIVRLGACMFGYIEVTTITEHTYHLQRCAQLQEWAPAPLLI